MRQYICDNCGKEIPLDLLFAVSSINQGDTEDYQELGEFCIECLGKIEKFIKEGFQ